MLSLQMTFSEMKFSLVGVEQNDDKLMSSTPKYDYMIYDNTK